MENSLAKSVLLPSAQDLVDAGNRIQHMVHQTPLLTSTTLNEIIGAKVWCKAENFQRMGAYKMRGASHAVSVLSEEQKAMGVVTHSSGNFAQAIALSAKLLGIQAHIVMPQNAPRVKVDAVRGYGAEIIFSGNRPEDRESKVNEVIAMTGATFIHPSNDLQVILGNSTCTQEIVGEVPYLDILLAPVGGGGLLAGTALAAHRFSPQTKVIAAEPMVANDAFRSFQSGRIEKNESANTIADGLRTNLGDVNFPIILQLVEGVRLVEEHEIIQAMKWVWERMKIIIEPSSAVAVAAAIRYREEWKDKHVGIILTGGNVDLDHLPW